MTERELSEKLSEIAGKIEELSDTDDPDWFIRLRKIAVEVRQLSNQTYSQGSVSWNDVKETVKKKKQPYANKTGRKMPF